MSRRLTQLQGSWTFIIGLITIAAACHSFVVLYDREVKVSLFPIAIIITIYLGYKAGRWIGLFAGFVSGLPATLLAWNLKPVDHWMFYLHSRPREVFDHDIGAILTAFSLESLLFTAVAGFLAGYLVDKFELFLKEHQLSLDYLFPVRDKKSILGRIFIRIELWMKPWRKSRDILEQIDNVNHETTTSETQPLKLQKAMRQALIKTIFLQVIILAVILNFVVRQEFGDYQLKLSLYLFPYYGSALLIITVAFFTSSRNGIVLSTFVFFVANIILFDPNILDLDIRSMGATVAIVTSGQYIGLMIFSWWAGKLGEVYRNKQKWQKVIDIWNSYTIIKSNARPPSDLFFVLIIIFSFALWVDLPIDYVKVTYHPYFTILAIASLYAFYRDNLLVSNRLFIFLLILCVIKLRFFLSMGESSGLNLTMGINDLAIAFLITIFVFIAGKLDLTKKSVCRLIIYGFMLSLLLVDVYLRNANFTFMFKVYINIKTASMMLSWILQLLFAELLILIMHSLAKQKLHIEPIAETSETADDKESSSHI